MGVALTVRNLKDLILSFNPSILFLVEKTMKIQKKENLKNKLKFDHIFVIDPKESQEASTFKFLEKWGWFNHLYEQQKILYMLIVFGKIGVEEIGSLSYMDALVFVDRKDLWNVLKSINRGWNETWCCARDPNQILFPHEKDGIYPPHFRAGRVGPV